MSHPLQQAGSETSFTKDFKPVGPLWFDSRVASWLYFILLILPILFLNGPAITHNFISDDWYILWDQADKGYNGQLFWLGWGYVRPIGVLTWKVAYHLFGLNSGYYYLLAALLQLADTWLVFSIVKRWLGSSLWGFVAGLIFATYYLGWEPTFWLSACFFDVQSAFFMLAALRLFLEYDKSSKLSVFLLKTKLATTFRFLLPVLIVVCYALATFSKETGLLLLPILIIYDLIFRLKELNWLKRLGFYSALLVVVFLFLVAHFWPGSKVTVGDTFHTDLIFENISYNLSGLYLFPVYPDFTTFTGMLKTQLKFALWLLPVLPVFGLILIWLWQNKFQSIRLGSNPRKNQGLKPGVVGLLLFGLIWTIVSSVATIALGYQSLRFLYVPHIGATFSWIAILILSIKLLQSLRLPRLLNIGSYICLVYIIGVLCVAGAVGFIQGRSLYTRSSDFTNQLITLANQKFQAGATDLTLVNVPKLTEGLNGSHANLFYDELNPPLVLLLEANIAKDKIKVLRTADLPQLGWDSVGQKVDPSTLPLSSNLHPVIIITRDSSNNFHFN